MALKRPKLKASKNKTSCLTEISPSFYNKIMSRNSSVGSSSRLSGHDCPSHIALDWEVRPGKAKYENPDSTDSDTDDETNCQSSSRVSGLPSSAASSSLPSTTGSIKSAKIPLKQMAKGLVKLVFTKPSNTYPSTSTTNSAIINALAKGLKRSACAIANPSRIKDYV